MTKAELLAAIWMVKHPAPEGDSIADYPGMFDELVHQFESLLDSAANDDLA